MTKNDGGTMSLGLARILKLFCLVFFSVQLSFLPTSSAETPTARRYLMAAMGDSISSAWLADTQVVTASFNSILRSALSGSSNKYTLSWSTGTSLPSHFTFLQASLKESDPEALLHAENVSVPSSQTKDLNKQAERLVELMKKNEFIALKYVTVTIGANDLCAVEPVKRETPDGLFRDHLRVAFNTLSRIDQAEPIHVLISAIPNLASLGKKEIQNATTLDGMSCRQIQKVVASYCDNLINWSDPEDFARLTQKVAHKNELLKSIVAEVNESHPSLRVVFSSAAYDIEITPEYLAGDCFHPSQLGQEKLAEKSWQDQSWY